MIIWFRQIWLKAIFASLVFQGMLAAKNPLLAQPVTTEQIESYLRTNISDGLLPLEFKGHIEAIARRGLSPAAFDENFQGALDINSALSAFSEAVDREAAQRELRLGRGLIVNQDGGYSLQVFEGLESFDPSSLATKVNEIQSPDLPTPLNLTPTEVAHLLQVVAQLKSKTAATLAKPIDSKKYRGLADESLDVRFNFFMDKNLLKIDPLPSELDTKPHGQLTGINKTPIYRIVLPGRQESFVFIDANYTDPYSPHALMFLARQLTRANGGEGRNIVLGIYRSSEDNSPPSIDFQYIGKPEPLSIQQAQTTKRAAYLPTTRNERAWAGLYAGYMIVCWYLMESIKHPGSFDGSLNSFAQFSSNAMHFFANHFHGIESHILFSTLVGLYYSAYTYLIFDSNIPKWKQTIRHLMFISMPAGLWTVAVLHGWGADDLFLTGAGWAAITYTAWNGLINNISRSFAHSVPAARDAHRVGMGNYKFLSFEFKKQQLMREALTFPLLFVTKIGHLTKAHPGGMELIDLPGLSQLPLVGSWFSDLSMGELGFYVLPFVMFGVSYSYFKWWTKDDVDYSSDRKKLVRDALDFLKSPYTITRGVSGWGYEKAVSLSGPVKSFCRSAAEKLKKNTPSSRDSDDFGGMLF